MSLHDLDFVSHIIQEHNFDGYDYKHSSRVLAFEPEAHSSKISINMAALELRENGDHYSVKQHTVRNGKILRN